MPRTKSILSGTSSLPLNWAQGAVEATVSACGVFSSKAAFSALVIQQGYKYIGPKPILVSLLSKK
jgi:hypothetical protein